MKKALSILILLCALICTPASAQGRAGLFQGVKRAVTEIPSPIRTLAHGTGPIISGHVPLPVSSQALLLPEYYSVPSLVLQPVHSSIPEMLTQRQEADATWQSIQRSRRLYQAPTAWSAFWDAYRALDADVSGSGIYPENTSPQPLPASQEATPEEESPVDPLLYEMQEQMKMFSPKINPNISCIFVYAYVEGFGLDVIAGIAGELLS